MTSESHNIKAYSDRAITGPIGSARLCLLLLAGVLLAGCAVPEGQGVGRQTRLPTDAEVEQYNAQAEPEERIVCRDEITVGTNIPERKCRYVRDIEATSAFHREQLRNILR